MGKIEKVRQKILVPLWLYLRLLVEKRGLVQSAEVVSGYGRAMGLGRRFSIECSASFSVL